MSTEIVSTPTGRVVEVEAHAGNVFLAIHGGSAVLNANVDGSRFLAAVATECDAIVIPRADLPEVQVDGDRYYAGGVVVSGAVTVERADESIRGWLAIREHLAAHPPVDVAQVEALAHVLAGGRPMSAEICLAQDASIPALWVKRGRDGIQVTTEGDGGRAVAVVEGPGLLFAVATECDAIAIPRADLPPVGPADDDPTALRADSPGGEGGGTWIRPQMWRDPAGVARQRAAEYLALAEYMDAHPPVDEAHVEALAHVLADSKGSPGSWRSWIDEARSLYALGVRVAEGRACRSCGWTPDDPTERVVGACVPGYHTLGLVSGVTR